jgi:hypothetical protein
MVEAEAMGYGITPRVRQLLEEFRLLSDDLHRHWLRSASAEARSEWELFCREWPTSLDIECGLVGHSESELDWMLAKALRFRAILASAGPLAPRGVLDSRP